ncbi:hypothetical protein L3Y34_007636 [Caenorhabditis briggsae]|uniref:glucuronosyltransferase n=1 Tax=Caenorhabditis briggsae TaxID=6238 RepID=A0AAE9A0E9_CAEBR|nr:hypothetical protein L3Y34_007636 [Caenorhabditis briggsae]
MKCMAIIANQLADAGHQVIFFQPFVVELFQNHDLIKNSNIEVINYWHDEEGKRNLPSHSALSDAWTAVKYQSDIGVKLFAPKVLHDAFQHMCRKMFEDKELHQTLKKKKFDVVLSETFDFCGLYLADYLEMPAIISVFTGSKLSAITDALGEPSFLHYYPSPSSHFGPSQSLYDRVNNLWYKLLSSSAFGELFDRQYADIEKITNGTVWFPQPSLLADKRVKLFITHGGLGSTMELAYAAKPGIVTPLFADQPSNAQMLARHGSVEVYSKHDIPNWEKQSDLLRKMLLDDKYQTAATRLAEILNHQPINPKELVVKHAENAARFGKMPSLTPFAKDMGFVEYQKSAMKNKPEYQLFKIRFIIDILYALTVSIYYTALIVSYLDPFILFHYKSLFFGTLLSSNVVSTRFILGAIISVERLIAVFFPVNIHNNRRKVSIFAFTAIVVFWGMMEDVMYFWVCDIAPFEKECSILGCTWNDCFVQYWTGTKLVIGAFTCSSSVILFVKLLFVKRAMNLISDLSKTNYLCIGDACLTLLFDFSPFLITLIFKTQLLSADIYGPYNATAKSLACFVDAIIATFILNKPSSKIVSIRSVNPRTATSDRFFIE